MQQFKEHAFPLDFIGVEPGWQSMAYPCTFEWDKTRFPKPEEFIANHPFLFYIIDNETKAILFMGRIMEPILEASK